MWIVQYFEEFCICGLQCNYNIIYQIPTLVRSIGARLEKNGSICKYCVKEMKSGGVTQLKGHLIKEFLYWWNWKRYK